MTRFRAILIGAAALPGCATASQERHPETPAAEGIALPTWAEDAPDRAASSSRSYETTRIEAAPEPEGDVTQALGARGTKRLRTMGFHQAPIAEVLRALSSAGSFNLVIAEGVPDSKITIELKNVTLRDALQAVLAAGQLEAVAIGKDVVLVRAAGRK